MGMEKMGAPSQEEQSKIQGERALSDVEFIKGGAEFKESGRSEAVAEQVAGINNKIMEKELKHGPSYKEVVKTEEAMMGSEKLKKIYLEVYEVSRLIHGMCARAESLARYAQNHAMVEGISEEEDKIRWGEYYEKLATAARLRIVERAINEAYKTADDMLIKEINKRDNETLYRDVETMREKMHAKGDIVASFDIEDCVLGTDLKRDRAL